MVYQVRENDLHLVYRALQDYMFDLIEKDDRVHFGSDIDRLKFLLSDLYSVFDSNN